MLLDLTKAKRICIYVFKGIKIDCIEIWISVRVIFAELFCTCRWVDAEFPVVSQIASKQHAVGDYFKMPYQMIIWNDFIAWKVLYG